MPNHPIVESLGFGIPPSGSAPPAHRRRLPGSARAAAPHGRGCGAAARPPCQGPQSTLCIVCPLNCRGRQCTSIPGRPGSRADRTTAARGAAVRHPSLNLPPPPTPAHAPSPATTEHGLGKGPGPAPPACILAGPDGAGAPAYQALVRMQIGRRRRPGHAAAAAAQTDLPPAAALTAAPVRPAPPACAAPAAAGRTILTLRSRRAPPPPPIAPCSESPCLPPLPPHLPHPAPLAGIHPPTHPPTHPTSTVARYSRPSTRARGGKGGPPRRPTAALPGPKAKSRALEFRSVEGAWRRPARRDAARGRGRLPQAPRRSQAPAGPGGRAGGRRRTGAGPGSRGRGRGEPGGPEGGGRGPSGAGRRAQTGPEAPGRKPRLEPGGVRCGRPRQRLRRRALGLGGRTVGAWFGGAVVSGHSVRLRDTLLPGRGPKGPSRARARVGARRRGSGRGPRQRLSAPRPCRKARGRQGPAPRLGPPSRRGQGRRTQRQPGIRARGEADPVGVERPSL